MSGGSPTRSVGVVMLAYGAEPVIDEAIAAVRASTGLGVSLVVVDNGCERDDLAELCRTHDALLVRPERNLGFAGGVNAGARTLDDPFLALVNSDAVVAPEALSRLVAVASDPSVGIASASVRLASDPTTMNSAGNPLHILGLSWAGGLGEPATSHAEPADVASASGACLALRREHWERLGGFPEEFFAYQEDLELSWRTWQLGLAVRYVPDAVAVHHYEFSRNPSKMYLLERNRLLFVLTSYGTRTLVLLAPAFLGLDLGMAAVAAGQGWLRQKARGWWWVLRHPAWVRRRRHMVQVARVVPDRELVRLWTDRFDAAAMPLPRWGQPLQSLLAGYWRVVRRFV